MGISSAVKKPQAQLQFHRSQRRRRTCDWRSCVMSKILFDVHELAHGHVFPRNRRAFCSCLDSYLSAQELENGRLAMFAFSGIVTQVAQWSEMWVVFSKAKTTKSSSLSLSLFKHGWVSSSIPIHKTTSYLFSFELFGTQNLLLMTYYEATCIVVWRQGLGCNAVHFFAEALLKFQLVESVENFCNLLRRATSIVVGQPLLGHHWCLVSLFLDKKKPRTTQVTVLCNKWSKATIARATTCLFAYQAAITGKTFPFM